MRSAGARNCVTHTASPISTGHVDYTLTGRQLGIVFLKSDAEKSDESNGAYVLSAIIGGRKVGKVLLVMLSGQSADNNWEDFWNGQKELKDAV